MTSKVYRLPRDIKRDSLACLQQKAEELSYLMVETTGKKFKEYEQELERLEEQIYFLEQELN